jgi:hypothetical protein
MLPANILEPGESVTSACVFVRRRQLNVGDRASPRVKSFGR